MIALAAIGSWGCCTVRWCDPKERIVIVKLSARGVSADPVVISKSKHQQILWKLPSGSPYTNVAIELGSNLEPFVACDTSEGICRIACENRLCLSGSINPLLTVPPKGLYYKYGFGGPTATSSDPGFRIDP
jgi:hypothetical protein